MGLFSSGGIGSVNTHANLETAKHLRKISKTLAQQQDEAARIQWCIDRILHLDARVQQLETELATHRTGDA